MTGLKVEEEVVEEEVEDPEEDLKRQHWSPRPHTSARLWGEIMYFI